MLYCTRNTFPKRWKLRLKKTKPIKYSSKVLYIMLDVYPFGHFLALEVSGRATLFRPSYLSSLQKSYLASFSVQSKGSQLHGIHINPSAPKITRLFYADDILIFGRATSSKVAATNLYLETYMTWLGHFLNRDKSSIHFSRNMGVSVAIAISELLNLSCLPAKAKHLVLPLIIPRVKSQAFSDLWDYILAKVLGWKAKLLSQSGRTILISAVASSILNYLMSSIIFFLGWCRNMERELKNFRWGFLPTPCNLTMKS